MAPLLKQHQLMARGEGLLSGDFDVPKLSSHAAGGPAPAGAGYLKDSQRAAKPPIGGNQSNPDHGPHS